MRKRALLYARVSTDDQADKGYSLPSQLDACRKYAERLGFEIVAELIEDYSGATPIAERPTGKQLVAMLKARQADAIVVYQVDRLSRDIVNLLATVQMWLRAGLEVHTCDIGKIESELDIVLVIKGWQGSDERKKIIERTVRGRNGKARAGKAVGTGFAPYGYRYADGQLIVVEEEAGVVRLIYIWYVKGETNEQGEYVPVATAEICRRLQTMGVPVPSKNHFWKVRGGVWSPSIIHKILKNETYVGVWRWGKNIGAGGRGGQRPLEEQIAVSVLAIIDRDLWDAAQAKREYNVSMSKRRARHDYLLRGLIKCSCGRRMVGRYRGDVKQGDPRYYRCPSESQTWLERKCTQSSVRANKVESCAWVYIQSLMENVVEYERLLRQAQKAELDEMTPKQEELETVEKLIADCEIEVSQCAAAMVRASGAVGRALEAKSQEVNARYEALTKRRDELTADLAEQQLTEQAIDAALRFREEVVAGMQNPSPVTKRRVLEMLGVEVRVKDTQVWVSCRVRKNQREFDSQTF